MLRKKIEIVIQRAAGNAQLAAVEVCALLEEEVGLSGNGWFEGDDVMTARLSVERQEDDQ
ncbi:hypothetical protein IMZ29_07105 [Achromobacter sp. GG226]|uniref:hypothetical protein n=1 Tax=Verticiella alkaliphila TaxID=2779529 RepID=UPI001C0E7343|nr:hypothetical protein [Verticiella sp. GG226]MBU4610315.1 hypothetical protein [Verticiella sp. GG226]